MRGFAIRVAVAAAALVLSLLPGAQSASAYDTESLVFAPNLAGPGDLVVVHTAACGAAASGLVYAKSLGGTVMLGPSALHPGRAEGSFRVFTSAEPGTYAVRGVCADGTHVGGVLKVPGSWVGGNTR